MSNKMSIPHDAIVFVGDGRKALFLRNAGDEKFPNLKTVQVFVDQNPATHDQGSDRPIGTNSKNIALPAWSLTRSRNWSANAR